METRRERVACAPVTSQAQPHFDRPGPDDPLFGGGLIAILRAPDASRLGAVADALIEAGITSLELTMTTRGALAAVRELAARLPAGVVLGAGTVNDVATADAVVEAGARYIVSPGVSLDVIARARELGVHALPGAATATEVLSAWNAGAAAVKLFPAAAFGPEYLRHLSAPLPDVVFVPTGGVGPDNAGDYIRAGAVAVGVGSPLLGDAATGGDIGALADRARRMLAAVAEARAGL